MSIEIFGGEQFAAVAAAFRQAEGDLPHEIVAALERAAPALEKAATESALVHLPHRGGLAPLVASATMATQRRAGGIRIAAYGIKQLRLTNEGRVRHPVRGNRRVWRTQSIPLAKNWFLTPMQNGAGHVRRELVKALDEIARRIA